MGDLTRLTLSGDVWGYLCQVGSRWTSVHRRSQAPQTRCRIADEWVCLNLYFLNIPNVLRSYCLLISEILLHTTISV